MLWHTEKSWSVSTLWSHLCSGLFFILQSGDISGNDPIHIPRSTDVDISFSCTCSCSHWRILHHCCTFSCSFLHSPRNLRHIPAAEPAPPASSPSSPSPSSNVTWKRIRSWPTKQSIVSRLQTVYYIAQKRGDKT